MKQNKMISANTFLYLLFSSSLALAGGMGNHGKDMMMDKEKEMGKHSKEMMTGQMTGMLTGAKGHQAVGKVSIIQKEKGKNVLMISQAKIDRVPDGRIYLAKNADYKKGVELGKLNQFSGDLEFSIPSGVNPDSYDSVVVWCKKFDVEIGHAFFNEKMMKK